MKRNPYADLGLVVAVAVLVVLLVKSLVFGLSWASLVCLVLTVAYLVVSAENKSDSRLVRHTTSAYMLLIVMFVVATVLFDKNARPKMHAFEGAATDTMPKEEFVVEDRDIPVEIAVADTVETDSLEADTLDLPEAQNVATESAEGAPEPAAEPSEPAETE